MESLDIRTLLEQRGCNVSFEDPDDMIRFLEAVKETDTWKSIQIKKCKTYCSDQNEGILSTAEGEIPLWDFDITGLEERSGDNAIGHRMMSYSQILDSMNNYWGLHDAKEYGLGLIRGGKLLSFHSKQYEPLAQSDLYVALLNELNKRDEGYTFINGCYTHELTWSRLRLDGAVSEDYLDAGVKAGFPEKAFRNAEVHVIFHTNDVGTSKATVIPVLSVGGDEMLLGAPISLVHRKGAGSLESWAKQLEVINLNINEEMSIMAELMHKPIMNADACCVRALKTAGLHNISMKASKELLDEMFFAPGTPAYSIYAFLHGILRTTQGERLSSERKMRVQLALRKLLVADWNKMDRPGPTEL